MFVAVQPPEDAVDHLDGFLEVRREQGDLRWSPPEQWHLTLAFIGELRERRLDDLLERLARAAGRRACMAARISGGGAFPDVGRARVLWTGLDVDDPVELDRLATGCRAAVAKTGGTVEGRRFRPHVTVARSRRPVEATRWVRVLDAYRGPGWLADHVELVESHLGEGPRGRPRHVVLERFELGRRP